MNDRRLLRQVVRTLADNGLPPLVFGGWASELIGFEPARPHQDIDLLVVAPTTAVDAFVASRDEVTAKRLAHKRAFIEDGVLVELFLVDPEQGTTCFWDEVVVAWPSLIPTMVDAVPVASAETLRLYTDRYDEIHSSRP